MNTNTVIKKILSVKEAANYIGISRSSFYEKTREGSKIFDATFPKEIWITPGRKGYEARSLDHWIETTADTQADGEDPK
ncbi:MAG: AlpA family phage regulatory protein [Pseudomonadota bacterium]